MHTAGSVDPASKDSVSRAMTTRPRRAASYIYAYVCVYI